MQRTHDLYQLIEKKLELFNEIYDITIAQREDIEHNNADSIEALVQSKQEIIDKIDKLDERFLSEFEKLKQELRLDSLEKADISKYPELRNIKEAVARIMEIAQQIMVIENSNKEKLDAIFEGVKSELKQIKAGKRSLKAYEPAPTYNDGIFIDKKK